jgi:hypothetical protein
MTEANPAAENVATGDVTREGERLLKQWLECLEGTRRAKEYLSRAECAEVNAHRDLAKWLMPPDMKPSEKIGVWVGDSLFQVEMIECVAHPVEGGEPQVSYEPKVTIRSRGKNFWRLK